MSACIVRTIVAAVSAVALVVVAASVLSTKLPKGIMVYKLTSAIASLAAATAAASACCAIKVAVFSCALSALRNATKRTVSVACEAAFCTRVFAPRWLPAVLCVRAGFVLADLLCPECSNAVALLVSDTTVSPCSLYVLLVVEVRSRNMFESAAARVSGFA
jgi:hypothetical protein